MAIIIIISWRCVIYLRIFHSKKLGPLKYQELTLHNKWNDFLSVSSFNLPATSTSLCCYDSAGNLCSECTRSYWKEPYWSVSKTVFRCCAIITKYLSFHALITGCWLLDSVFIDADQKLSSPGMGREIDPMKGWRA